MRMRRLFAALAALGVLTLTGTALAQVKISADGAGYAVGDPFRLRVRYDLPAYIDTMSCKSVVEICGVEIDPPDIEVKSGEYEITGVIECFPSYVTVGIEDGAGARAAQATYRFVQNEIEIPNTGGAGAMKPLAVICTLCAAAILGGRRLR